MIKCYKKNNKFLLKSEYLELSDSFAENPYIYANIYIYVYAYANVLPLSILVCEFSIKKYWISTQKRLHVSGLIIYSYYKSY